MIRSINTFRWTLLSMLFLSSAVIHAQVIEQSTAMGSVKINVARKASIDCSQNLIFDHIIAGFSDERNPWESGAMRFKVIGEGTAYIDVSFPLGTILYLNGSESGVGKEIPFTRYPVKFKASRGEPSTPISTDPNWVVDGQDTNPLPYQIPFPVGPPPYPGVPSGSDPKIWFWVGGRIDVPSNATSGDYIGGYTVTISNYHM